MSDSVRSSIVLVIDGLGAAWLGPYGNTWFDTPALNELAAESLLVEQVLAGGPSLEAAYGAYWRGAAPQGSAGPLPAAPPAARPGALLDELGERGVRTALVTDELEVAELPEVDCFQESICWTPPAIDEAAYDPLETQVGAVLAAAADAASRLPEPFCLWVHAQGLAGMWDAPWQLRAELADEDDPEPPRWAAPPCGRLSADQRDPDLLLGWMLAAAGQVRAIDFCLATMLELSRRRDALLLLTSPRGYPLGEHGEAGLQSPKLYGELLQTPLLIRWPDGRRAAARTQQLVQGDHVHRVLRGWHQCGPEPDWPPLPDRDRQLAWAADGEQVAVRTASWFARLAGDAVELFSKPDDHAEVNEVADRCVEEAEAMAALAGRLRQGEPAEIPPLLYRPHD